MLVVAGVIKLDPAKRAEADTAFDKMRAASLAEPGCIEYQAYAGRGDAGTLFIFEKWQDQAALDAHFASAHMAEFGAATGGLGVTAMEVKKYEVSSEGGVP